MGRRVYNQKGEFVWKYVFGAQDSEQGRIADELGIGRYRNRELNATPNYQFGDLLMLSRKDIEKLVYTIKPLRRQIASFMRKERAVYGKAGSAPMGKARDLYAEAKAQNKDILFHLMCHYYTRSGKQFFKAHPHSKTMNCYGEF